MNIIFDKYIIDKELDTINIQKTDKKNIIKI